MSSSYGDLERPPLHEAALRRVLLGDGPGGGSGGGPNGRLWTDLRVVAETGSTNADLAAAARGGAPAGSVLVTEKQTAGRGRLGRGWEAPARSGLMFSLLLRPTVPVERLGWLPLLTGLAVVRAIRRLTAFGAEGEGFFDGADGDAGVDARLKWPNDILVSGRKLGGILVEREGDAVVVGIGLNVSLHANELPVPSATSLLVAGAPLTDRAPLLRAVLRAFADQYVEWIAHDGDPDRSGVRPAYRELCATLGLQVRVELPGDRRRIGIAQDVDAAGRLVVDGEALSAGDVVHVRPATP